MIRFLLAISVVVTHTFGAGMVGGVIAVQLFYLVSGFVISLIISEKRYKTLKAFYFSRFLRLYPTYILVAALTFLGLVAERSLGGSSPFFSLMENLDNPIKMFLGFANTTMLFQDWVMFLGINGSEVVFVSAFYEESVQLWQGLLIPQAWTLGVEIAFYLIAPYILTRRRLLIAIAIASLCLRLIFIEHGLGLSDPWTYRFFPLEIGTFALGALAHQFLLPLIRRGNKLRVKKTSTLVTFGFALIILTYPLLPGSPVTLRVLITFACVIFLPYFHIFQENRKFDRFVGEISYPLYICHVLVLRFILQLDEYTNNSYTASLRFVTIVASVAFAVFLNITVVQRIDKFRIRLRNF